MSCFLDIFFDSINIKNIKLWTALEKMPVYGINNDSLVDVNGFVSWKIVNRVHNNTSVNWFIVKQINEHSPSLSQRLIVMDVGSIVVIVRNSRHHYWTWFTVGREEKK